MVKINPNDLLLEYFDPNQEDECCYYDQKMYANVNTIIIHAIIFEYAHTKTDWIMMKDIAKQNLNVTHMLDKESDLPLFALAEKGKSGNMEASYVMSKPYPLIINELL